MFPKQPVWSEACGMCPEEGRGMETGSLFAGIKERQTAHNPPPHPSSRPAQPSPRTRGFHDAENTGRSSFWNLPQILKLGLLSRAADLGPGLEAEGTF